MSWATLAVAILGLVLGCWIGMGWRFAGVWRAEWRAGCIRAAARTLKTSHRKILIKMELGWRERDETRRTALEDRRTVLEKQEQRMHTLLSRLVTTTPEYAGDVLCFYTSMPERVLYEVAHPLDERDYIHYVAEHVAHLVRVEICTLNAKRLHEMRVKPELEVYGLRSRR